MEWSVRTVGIVVAIAFLASMSTAAVHGQSFYIATSKDTYYENERVVVVGTVSNTEDRRPVVVTITSDEDDCARQNVRPLRDGSFVSRPMIISGCGPGDFNVTATHAGMTTTSSSFTVEHQHDVADSPELRGVKATVTQAQNIVNSGMKEMIAANLAIPEQATETYGKGVSAASLALQAVERGDLKEALEHRAVALKHFNDAFGLLSQERLSGIAEQVREEETRVSAAREWFGRLQDLFRRLVDLAEKNDLGVFQEFDQIDSLLASARQLIGERNVNDAEEALHSADRLLEEVREKLFQNAEPEDQQAEALTSAVERIENSAYILRQEAAGEPRALAQVNASFIFINSAKSSIAEGNHDSAKRSLELAFKTLDRVKEIIESRR